MKSNFRPKLCLIVLLLGGAARVTMVPVWAQDAPPASASSNSPTASTGLQEVVVTAQRREQNAQDVGLELTAIGQQGLQMLGHQDLIDLTQQVPNLQAQQYSPSVTVLNVRGVSQNDVTNAEEAPVAFYNDGAYVSAMGAIDGQTFDLQRVEVLEGPQGTLFGRNATGGAIQIISAKPTKDFEGYASLTYGSFDEIASDAAISGPLGDGISGRLAFTSNSSDDYIQNLIGPGAGDRRFYGARGQLQADFGDGGTLLGKVEFMRDDHESQGAYTAIPAGVNAYGVGFPLAPDENFWGTCPGCSSLGYKPPSNPYVGEWQPSGWFDRDYYNVELQYDQPLSFGKLTSISDYQVLHTDYAEDSDVSPLGAFLTFAETRMYQYSEELRLAGATDRLTWLVGAYGLRIHSFDWYGNDGMQFFGFDVSYGGDLDTTSWALFTQEEYKLTDVFSVIAGARYNDDEKDDYYTNYYNGFLDYTFTPSTFPQASQLFRNWQGKLELDAKPNKGTLLYVSWNRGTKAGGYDTLLFPPPTPEQMDFKQEVLIDYEGGFKLTLADNRLTFNGNVFHYDYHDYQAFSAFQFSEFVTNHPATENGTEFQLTARPVAALQLSAFVTKMFTERVDDVVMPAGQSLVRDFPQDPRSTFGGSVAYAWQLPVGSLQLSTDWKYNSPQYFTAFNAPIDYERAETIGNVRLTFDPGNSNWEVAFFVNNVTDRLYRVFDYDNSVTLGEGQSVFAPPRWYGGTVTYRF